MALFGTTLEWDHQELSEIILVKNVPEDIRNYFETIKNECLYARFVYPFYVVADFLTYPLMELALRRRLEGKRARTNRGFKALLKEAIRLGLIREHGFSHIRRMKEQDALLVEAMQNAGIPIAPMGGDYRDVLALYLPKLRNRFAHPEAFPIYTPGLAFFSIQFAAEFINQLFVGHRESP